MLTGKGWVTELLGGHPECIRCKLGIVKFPETQWLGFPYSLGWLEL